MKTKVKFFFFMCITKISATMHFNLVLLWGSYLEVFRYYSLNHAWGSLLEVLRGLYTVLGIEHRHAYITWTSWSLVYSWPGLCILKLQFLFTVSDFLGGGVAPSVCAQGLLQTLHSWIMPGRLEGLYEVPRMEPGASARQTPYLVYYHSGPCFRFFCMCTGIKLDYMRYISCKVRENFV